MQAELSREAIISSDNTAQTGSPGVMLGKIVSLSVQGTFVQLREVTTAPVFALSVCAVSPKDVGQICVIQFIEGDSTRPIIMGLLKSPEVMTPGTLSHELSRKGNSFTVSQQGQRTVIDSEDELVIRCGESQIVMTPEGVIQIRALYIDSHAEATHRLKGGSVQVN